jgi:hypothetical protein
MPELGNDLKPFPSLSPEVGYFPPGSYRVKVSTRDLDYLHLCFWAVEQISCSSAITSRVLPLPCSPGLRSEVVACIAMKLTSKSPL